MTSVLIARTELQQALGGAPSLIVVEGVAGAGSLALEGLTVWHARTTPQGMLLHRGARAPDTDLMPLTLALPGVLAIVAASADDAQAISAWIRNASDLSPPVIEAASGQQALAPLTGLLLRRLDQMRAQLGQVQRSMAMTRMDYEETRIAMGTVLRTLGNRPPAALRPTLSTRPASQAVRPAGQRLRLRQVPGIVVREIAALAFHLATATCSPDMLLRVRLVAVESGRVLGSWLLPGHALEPGWVTLDLPTPAPALRETAMIEIAAELGERDSLSLSLEEMTTDRATALAVLEGEADAADRALALRVWTAGVGSRFVLARHWQWDEKGLSLPDAGLPYLLPESDWSRSVVIEGKARALGLGQETPRPIAVLEENTSTLLGLPAIQVAGMDVVRVELGLLAGMPGRVRAGIWLRDASRLDSLSDAELDRPGTRFSGWRDFDAHDERCVITLGLPVTAENTVQVVIGLSAPHPQTGAPCAIEVQAVSALRTEEDAGRARPSLAGPDGGSPAAALQPAARFGRVRLGGQSGTPFQTSLDLMVSDLSSRQEMWPEVRFKLSTGGKAGPGIEIRRGPGWPEVFETWPGTESDAQGPFFSFGPGDMAKLAPPRNTRDGRLVAALIELLPKLVEDSILQDREAGAQKTIWLAAAEQLAEAGRRRRALPRAAKAVAQEAQNLSSVTH
jgi:hypothetical protein